MVCVSCGQSQRSDYVPNRRALIDFSFFYPLGPPPLGSSCDNALSGGRAIFVGGRLERVEFIVEAVLGEEFHMASLLCY